MAHKNILKQVQLSAHDIGLHISAPNSPTQAVKFLLAAMRTYRLSLNPPAKPPPSQQKPAAQSKQPTAAPQPAQRTQNQPHPIFWPTHQLPPAPVGFKPEHMEMSSDLLTRRVGPKVAEYVYNYSAYPYNVYKRALGHLGDQGVSTEDAIAQAKEAAARGKELHTRLMARGYNLAPAQMSLGGPSQKPQPGGQPRATGSKPAQQSTGGWSGPHQFTGGGTSSPYYVSNQTGRVLAQQNMPGPNDHSGPHSKIPGAWGVSPKTGHPVTSDEYLSHLSEMQNASQPNQSNVNAKPASTGNVRTLEQIQQAAKSREQESAQNPMGTGVATPQQKALAAQQQSQRQLQNLAAKQATISDIHAKALELGYDPKHPQFAQSVRAMVAPSLMVAMQGRDKTGGNKHAYPFYYSKTKTDENGRPAIFHYNGS